MYRPGQIITLKPDGINNKRFRVTRAYWYNTCIQCREQNMNVLDHNVDEKCPSTILYNMCITGKIPVFCYLKPID